ncbi:gamma-glutamyltransferase family protein [Flagellimonas sp.]|uniref:gamma-glutamyltransferase family protein n=1 Tax=Flagellimonas sp. TaxID=2058762 RepID=UPI003B50D150
MKKTIFLFILLWILVACKNNNDQILGAVSSAAPEASHAGELILKKGGNAVDAAIAVSFTLAVTEPAMSGLGGGSQVLLSIKNQKPIAINGTTFSPALTNAQSGDTLSYHRRSTIPSTVKVLDYLYRHYGSGKVTWEELVQPAIGYAENGFEIGPFRAKVYKRYAEKLKSSPHNTHLFLIDGRVPRLGEKLKQPILAKTLRRIAKFGADDFYKGEIAQSIADDMRENQGWISLEDLQRFPEPKELEPLTIAYRDHQVYSQPPPCGGWTALMIMKLLDVKSQGNELGINDLIEALYLGQNDRRQHPVTDLIDYEAQVAEKLSDVYIQNLLKSAVDSEDSAEIIKEGSGETTHFSVVDSEGTAIAVTASINAYFGSLAASERLGFLYNSYMDDFTFGDPEHPFALQPNAMAYSSMSPTIVQKNKENVLVIGSPGSSRIISSVAQLSAEWIYDQDISHLVKKPRIHVNRNRAYLEEKKDTLLVDKNLVQKYNLEFRVPNESLIIYEQLNSYYGGIHAIAKEKSKWVGVADPRRDGLALIVKD